MSKTDTPFNMLYIMSDDLREVPEDAEQMRCGIDFLYDKIEETEDDLEKVQLFSQVGFYLRLIGNYEKSIDAFDQATFLARELNSKNELDLQLDVIEIRRSSTLLWMGNFRDSFNILNELLHKHRKLSTSKYLDFILQHLGKIRFEQKQYKDALGYFLEALELRIIKGNLELIQSSEQAIAQTRKQL